MPPSKPRLYLVDTLFHIFRTFHALPKTLKSDDGVPTNALHGVVSFLRSLYRSEGVTHLAAVFESTVGNFREELSADYKATRKPAPPGLKEQVPLVKEACLKLGLSVWELDRHEADDTIGVLAKLAVDSGMAVTIVSNDKDMAQLLALDGDVELMRMHSAKKIERLKRADVPAVFGVEAHQIPSYLALRGDAVDNIAGLHGVGEKTALKWLSQVDGVEELLADPSIAGARWAPLIEENEDSLRLDLDLATIRTEVDLKSHGRVFCVEDFRPQPFDEGLADFFYRYSMVRHTQAVESLLYPEPTVEDLWAV